MANKGNHTVLVVEKQEQFLPAKQVLKNVAKKKPQSVVVIAVSEEGEFDVYSSHRHFADTVCDLVQAQHHMMNLAKE